MVDSDEETKVACIAERRRKKRAEQAERVDLYENYRFGDNNVGVDETGVVMSLSGLLAGLIMSPDDAEELGMALIQSAAIVRLEREGLVEYVDGDDD